MNKVKRVENPRLILGFTLTCLLVGAGSFALGKNSSTSQEEALASAQTSISVYASAEHRPLGNTATYSGSVQVSASQEINYQGSGVVTTANIEEGDIVRPGDIVATVDSNPIIAVIGSNKPIYRDLYSGDSGYDVEAVQEILNQLGYRVAINGKFDEGTEKAVERLYKNVGYTSPCGEKICVLTGTFLKIPENLPPVSNVIRVGSNTLETPVLFSTNKGERSVVARIGVAQKADFEGKPEIAVSGPDGEIIRTTEYSFSDFKEGNDSVLPGYDLVVPLPQDLTNIPADKTVVNLTLKSDNRDYLAVPATAIRQEGTETYLLTEAGDRIGVTILIQSQGWAGIAETEGISEGTRVKVS